ncbi:MAG: DHH family phosphoesterase [Candidatus Pacebacteria bacterium]|nr:DHH family phosphoesterase [Candidatus Paceibacterota bacterium]
MKKILITPKINPDLDGFACAYAYTKLLQKINTDNNVKYVCGISGNFQPEVQFMINYLNIDDFFYNPDDNLKNFDKFIIVDASDIKGMPSCIKSEKVIEVIDHREKHEAEKIFPNAKIQVDLIGAAATIIFEKYRKNDYELTRNIGILLYGAIHSNTLNLKMSLTSSRDKLAVKYLQKRFNIHANLINEMFLYKTKKIFNDLEINIINDFKVVDFSLGRIGIAQIEGIGILNFIENNLLEIKKILSSLKVKNNLKYIFLTAVDVKNEKNIFIVIDDKTKDILSSQFTIKFNEGLAMLDEIILRKQIIPLL